MITVKSTVLKHHKKADGTYNVKIRVTQNRVSRYLDTNHFVGIKQLNKSLEIKDPIISLQVDKTLNEYRFLIGELGHKASMMSCDEVVKYLKDLSKEIDFIEYSRQFILELEESGKSASAANYKTVLNSMVDYFKREKVLIYEINASMLILYERYLRSDRKITRLSKNKNAFIINNPGLSDGGLHNHMRDLRVLFNAARNHFNDEDLGIIRIPHYPFKKYKIIERPETTKRNIQVLQILKIRDSNCIEGSQKEIARDLFILSFYFCGTNSVDFYYMDHLNINNGRLEYKRSKTKGKRKDKAFISIKIVDEAKPLLEKYIGTLKSRYSSYRGLTTALSNGMKEIRETEGISDVTFYWARHSFATIARNVFRKSKDDVAMALNHIDEGRKTADIYIQKDWHIVDEVQEAVVNLLR